MSTFDKIIFHIILNNFRIDFSKNFKYISINILKRKLKIMAVPKKRQSKTKTRQRKANWKRQSYFAAQKSLSLAKSMLRGKPTSFVYTLDVEEE